VRVVFSARLKIPSCILRNTARLSIFSQDKLACKTTSNGGRGASRRLRVLWADSLCHLRSCLFLPSYIDSAVGVATANSTQHPPAFRMLGKGSQSDTEGHHWRRSGMLRMSPRPAADGLGVVLATRAGIGILPGTLVVLVYNAR